MTMIFREVPKDQHNPPVATVRLSGEESIANFKALVNRAANCWDRAPVEVKEFCDVVTEGRILQDYSAQEGKPSNS